MSSTVPDQPTSSAAASSSAATMLEDPRPLIVGDDPCEGDPPFVATYLPAGFSGDVTAGPPDAGPDRVPELYDPLFHFDGPGTSSIAIYHGNSWRLAVTYQAETEVLGRTAWISTIVNGNRWSTSWCR